MVVVFAATFGREAIRKMNKLKDCFARTKLVN